MSDLTFLASLDVLPLAQIYTIGAFEIGFDSVSGSINHMTFNGTSWASPSNMLAYLTYRMYDQQEVLVCVRKCPSCLSICGIISGCVLYRNSLNRT